MESERELCTSADIHFRRSCSQKVRLEMYSVMRIEQCTCKTLEMDGVYYAKRDSTWVNTIYINLCVFFFILLQRVLLLPSQQTNSFCSFYRVGIMKRCGDKSGYKFWLIHILFWCSKVCQHHLSVVYDYVWSWIVAQMNTFPPEWIMSYPFFHFFICVVSPNIQ